MDSGTNKHGKHSEKLNFGKVDVQLQLVTRRAYPYSYDQSGFTFWERVEARPTSFGGVWSAKFT